MVPNWPASGNPRLAERQGGSVLIVPGLSHLRQDPSGTIVSRLLPYDPTEAGE